MRMRKSYKNLVIIFFLGISSGLPLALILSTLKAWLLEKGFDLKTIGYFSLIAIPYSLKIFFAPIIDSYRIPFLSKFLGQRKSWILLTQILLTIFIALLGIAGISLNIFAISLFGFLVALTSASQDIVIDGYRIQLIEKENQGFAASFYVYGYRIGMLISGALALVLAEKLGWESVYFIMSGFMLTATLITICAEETKTEETKTDIQKNQNFISWFKDFVIAPLFDFTKQPQWIVIIGFIICFKLADAFAGNLTLPFLLEIGFSKIEIASIVKTFGLFATLSGVFVGGFLVKKINIIKALWISALMQMLSNLAFSYLAQIGNNKEALYAIIFIENFSGGIGDAIFIAYLSSLCNLAFSATQYALLVSCATIARSTLTAFSGSFAEVLGWYNFFIFSALLAIPSLILLYVITWKNFVKLKCKQSN